MATETPPKLKRASPGKSSDERVIYMTKTAPEVDHPRLAMYTDLGYVVEEEPWRYRLVGSQAAYEQRQKEYQQKGIAQAERVSKQRDAEGLDNSREETISTVSRVAMTADDILGMDVLDSHERGGLSP